MSAHYHTCPNCGVNWPCVEEGPVWDQEDSDCRWFSDVTCDPCMKKRETETGVVAFIGFEPLADEGDIEQMHREMPASEFEPLEDPHVDTNMGFERFTIHDGEKLMAIFAKAGPSFKPAPAGAHAAVCCDVVDLGDIKVAYGGKEKTQHKIRIVWQIPELRDDGNQFTVSKRYTLSLHEKSSLRKDLESWRGRPFNETELQGFDIEALLSAAAMINVMHVQRDGSTFANVTSIMRLPKGMEAPKVFGYVRVCDRQPENGSDGPPAEDFGYGPITDDDVPF